MSLRSASRAPCAVAVDSRVDRIVDRVCADWPADRGPGFALAVVDADGSIARRVQGVADLERGVSIASDTVFNLNCLSKPFIGMAAALLEIEERIRPDDPVRKYLPELSASFDAIRLAHLIHHTSGLRDLTHLLWICGAGDPTADEACALVGRQRDLLFPPGARFMYSRTGYFLLCRVLARVIGDDLSGWFAANLFEPLGMTASYLAVERASIRGSPARGYRGGGAAVAASYRTMPTRWHYADIGVYATLGDLCRWDRHLAHPGSGRLGRTFVERCFSCGRLTNGALVPYGYGLAVWTQGTSTIVSHSARDNGLRHVYLHEPATRCSVVMLSNHCDADVDVRAMTIVDELIGTSLARLYGGAVDRPSIPSAAASAEIRRDRIDHAMLERCAGRFHSPELDVTFDAAIQDEGLSLQCGSTTVPLVCTGPGAFRGRTIKVTFPLDDRRRAAGLAISSSTIGRIECVRTSAAPLMTATPIGALVESSPSPLPVDSARALHARLCAMWAETLGLDTVHPADDFFELGGDSLLAIHLVGRIERELGVRVPAGGIFTCPTVVAFARLLEGHDHASTAARAAPSAAEGPIGDASVPLLPMQRLTLAWRGSSDPRTRVTACLIALDDINETVLIRALDAWAQQDAFRLHLRRDGATWRQHCTPVARYDYVGIDEWELDTIDDRDALIADLAERCWTFSSRPVIPSDIAPLRLVVLRSGGRPRYVLCLADAMSVVQGWPRLIEDLQAAYETLRATRTLPPSEGGLFRREADRAAARAADDRVTRGYPFWRLQWERVARRKVERRRQARRRGTHRAFRASPLSRREQTRTALVTAALSAVETQALAQACGARRLTLDALCLGTLLWALRGRVPRRRVLVAIVDRGAEVPAIYPAFVELPRVPRLPAFIHFIGAQHARYAEQRDHYGALRYLHPDFGPELAAVEEWRDALVFDCPRALPPCPRNGHDPRLTLSDASLALDHAYQRLADARTPLDEWTAARRPATSAQIVVLERRIHLVVAFEASGRNESVMARWVTKAAQGLGRIASM